MNKFKLIVAINILGLMPALCFAEDSLQSAVISKVSADHATEMKNGSFSQRQGSSKSSASRASASLKNSLSSSAPSKPALVSKSHLNEKREAAKRRAQLIRR